MLPVKPRQYQLLAWSSTILIIVLSLLPGSSLPKDQWFHLFAADKIFHFASYAFATWCYLKYYALSLHLRIGIAMFILGCLLECLQYFMQTGRNFDALDLLFNAIGIYLAMKLNRKKHA